MKLITCLCEQCRYRIQRQKKHGVSRPLIETRAARRIVKQKLKHAVTHQMYDVDIPNKRRLIAQG